MRAVLSTDVPIVRFAAFAEMAWLERRPELGLLCRAARDGGRRISGNTVHAVLPGLPDAGADNVVRWCHALGLCDASGSLTALGDDVADTDEAPVPEQGIYDLWLARHPLLGRRLLAVERLASGRDGRFEHIEPLELEPDRGVVFRSVCKPQERFVLRALPSNHGGVGVLPRITHATCRIRWTLDFEAERDHWMLEGTIEGPQCLVPIQHEPEQGGLDPWAVMERWGAGPLTAHGRWDARARRLAVPLAGLTADEQDRFVTTLRPSRVDVPGMEAFDDVVLEDVPIGPATDSDAQAWAMDRLWRRLETAPRYRSRSNLRELLRELCEGTALEPYAPTLPTHERCIGDARRAKNPEVFWNLAAPVDLAPQLPAPEDLGELGIGVPMGGGR